MALEVKPQNIPKFDLQGHRGARGLMPENTIAGFITALDSGVTTLEMDVVITKDKKVIVSHEPWMSAAICYDKQGKEFPEKEEKQFNIYRMTYGDTRLFDCGSRKNERFPEQHKMAAHKPLLKDMFEAVEHHIRTVSHYEADYNIEIKSNPESDHLYHPAIEEYTDLVYEVVKSSVPPERVVIQSFDFRMLRYCHEKYPRIRLAVLVGNLKSVKANLKELGFTPSIYSPYYKLINKDQIAYLHNLGIRVIPWTVNDSSDMLLLKEMGVDGIITDYPDRARKSLSFQRE